MSTDRTLFAVSIISQGSLPQRITAQIVEKHMVQINGAKSHVEDHQVPWCLVDNPTVSFEKHRLKESTRINAARPQEL